MKEQKPYLVQIRDIEGWDELREKICKVYGINDPEKILARTKAQPYNEARQVLMYCLYRNGVGPSVVEKKTGYKHSTVKYSYDKIQGYIDTYKEYQWINEL